MAALLKVLMILLTIACAAWEAMVLIATTKAGGQAKQPGESIGIGCCFTLGTSIAGIVWMVGMVPLGILYFVFKPSPSSSSAKGKQPPT